MNHQIKFPKVRWDRVIIMTAGALGVSLFLAIVTRSKTFLMLFQFLDVAFVLALLGMLVYALAKRYTK